MINTNNIERLAALFSALPDQTARNRARDVRNIVPLFHKISFRQYTQRLREWESDVDDEVMALLEQVRLTHPAVAAYERWIELVELNQYEWGSVTDATREARRQLNWQITELSADRRRRIEGETLYASDTAETLIQIEIADTERLIQALVKLIATHEREQDPQAVMQEVLK